ncbi:MAG: UDP-N-acetylmuramoyl-L-alanine--D-glutamate ligase [Armatimonadetes bacterium]|nr:UDP-N-acetylmuramoyl-L-alanine--D-glutamate ligase [Armatimonadota bacterium]
MNEFQGKVAAVIGLARAGAPAAKFLAEKGARVIGFDGKTRENLSAEALELENRGVELVLGQHGFAGIEVCDLIVLSPGLKVHFEPLQSVIAAAEARGAEVIGELELASRFCPCPIIGVTGTKGKSTTTKLITEMLRACGVDAIAAGNTGTPLIEILPDLGPESWAVVEVSSFQLEKAPTFRPKIAVLLSLLEDHQDYHPTLGQYWETKLKIFANQGEGDWAIYNFADELANDNVRRYFSLDRHGVGVNVTRPHRQFFELDSFGYWSEDGFEVILHKEALPLRGQHNINNIKVALEVVSVVLGDAMDAELTINAIDAIRNFQTLPHRLEIVAQKDGITWVNDSQSTIPDAAIAALKSFPAPVTLLVGGRAKIEAEGYLGLMRAIRDQKARLILYGEAAEMLYGVALSLDMENLSIFREKTLADAVRTAKIQSSKGESILLSPACASFDQFTSYEHRGETFRQLVRDI